LEPHNVSAVLLRANLPTARPARDPRAQNPPAATAC